MDEDKLERLRARVAGETDRQREDGRAAGEAWALDADPAELRRLDAAARADVLWTARGHFRAPHPGEHALLIFAAITGAEVDEFTPADEADGFWAGVLGDAERIRDRAFAAAFVAGARAVLKEASRPG